MKRREEHGGEGGQGPGGVGRGGRRCGGHAGLLSPKHMHPTKVANEEIF